MRLARAAVPQGDHVLAPADILGAGELEDEHLVQAGDGGEVERVQALHRREPGGADPAFDHAALPVDQLQLDEPQKIAGVVHAVAGALARHLLILAQHGGQLELLEVMGEQDLRRAARRARRHRSRLAGHAASPA